MKIFTGLCPRHGGTKIHQKGNADMAMVKYFNGDIELVQPHAMDNAKFIARFPGVKGRKYDGYAMWVGTPAGVEPVYVAGEGWNRGTVLPVERIVTYKIKPV